MQFILVRHAHAEWPNYHGPDFERPLTSRGLADARATGRGIAEAGHRPTLLLASPACRTRQTAQLLAEELQLPETAVRCIEDLYNATASTLETELRKVARPESLVVLVAHNPGVSNLIRVLTHDPQAPPCQPAEWRLLQLP
ncbi:MAG TPA: histidine phosphatase family protein [Steroidobacteraceae bacterium]|nr:histidine phosphatase family protein [Steroidobacteraceae bacterium]